MSGAQITRLGAYIGYVSHASSDQTVTRYPDYLLDFLYVDVGRVRSYLAQLAGGVAETASDAIARTRGLTAEGGLPVAKGGRATSTTETWATTRALGDLIVPAFEEEAAAAGFLIDVSHDYSDPESWYRGDVHAALPVGSIIRHTGPARMFDAVHLSQLVQHFEGMVDAMLRLSGAGGGGSHKSGGRATPKGAATDIAGLRGINKMTEPIRRLIENLLAGGISLRTFPCGADNPDCGFGGLLLDRSDYIEPERGAVFARHGVAVSDWTVVGVVTRVSERAARREMEDVDPGAMIRESGGINRPALEGLVLQFLEVFEGLGMSEGPAWPSITITPLAVYRAIEKPPGGSAEPSSAV